MPLLHHRSRPTGRLDRLASGGTWLFIVASLVSLLLVMLEIGRHPGEPVAMVQTTADGIAYDAWGLSYVGAIGFIRAGMQWIILAAAAVASVLAHDRARRAGLATIVVWACWCALSLIVLALRAPFVSFVFAAALSSGLAACTVGRAMRNWRSLAPAGTPTIDDAGVVESPDAIEPDAPFGFAPTSVAEAAPKTPSRAGAAFIAAQATGRRVATRLRPVAQRTVERSRPFIVRARGFASRTGHTVMAHARRVKDRVVAALRERGMLPGSAGSSTRA